MQNLGSLLLTLLGVILFIWLLPTLLWIVLIVAVVVLVYVNIQKAKYRKYMNDMEDSAQGYREEYTSTYESKRSSSLDSDVIDVEYTESEDNES